MRFGLGGDARALETALRLVQTISLRPRNFHRVEGAFDGPEDGGQPVSLEPHQLVRERSRGRRRERGGEQQLRSLVEASGDALFPHAVDEELVDTSPRRRAGEGDRFSSPREARNGDRAVRRQFLAPHRLILRQKLADAESLEHANDARLRVRVDDERLLHAAGVVTHACAESTLEIRFRPHTPFHGARRVPPRCCVSAWTPSGRLPLQVAW